MRVKFLQYNIAACRNYEFDKNSRTVIEQRTLDAIRDFDADIVTVNEIDENTKRSGNVNQPKLISDALGYNYYFAPSIELEGGHYGIALFSKYDIISAQMIRIPDCFDCTGRLLERRVIISAVLDVEGRQLRVMMSHYGLSPAEQENAVECTLKELENSALPTIFSGDLNMKPDNPLIKKLSLHLNDSATLFKTLPITYPSWGEDDCCDTLGKKIDYIFAKGEIKAENVLVPQVRVSDHLPYYCELSF
ncbi:MAG: hypothetical protein E7588_01350 [Ruminococcaceae bacterium]|nr:hypothetical protein [Oscillospiraceae bacterium]